MLSPSASYGLLLEWLWDGWVTPDGIDRAMGAFARAGIREVCIEAWDGIVAGTEPGISTFTPYLSDAHLDLLVHAAGSARSHGIGLWIYDGNGAGDDTAVVQAVLADDPLLAATTMEPDGDGGFVARRVPDRLDRLSVRATVEVLARQHDRIVDALGSDLVRDVLRGFWKDEPTLPGGIPWSEELVARFAERHRYPLDDAVLRSVVSGTEPDDRRRRVDFWSTVAATFGEAHLGTVQAWHREHGLQSLVQPIPDGTELAAQMRSTGSLAAALAWADVPGCDMWPGGWTDQPLSADAGGGAAHAQVSSTAHLHGRRRAQAEPYGLQGWGLEVRQQKVLADRLLARGITVISPAVTHQAYTVSQATFAGDFGPANGPMWRFVDLLQTHIGRVGALLDGASHVAPIAVLHPQTSIWALDPATEDPSAREAEYRRIVGALQTTWRGFDIVDEGTLADPATTVGDGAIVRHDHRFTSVVVPAGEATLLPSTRAVLDALVAGGGTVVTEDGIPSLRREIVIDTPAPLGNGPANECFHVRRPGEDVYLVTNFPEGAHLLDAPPVGHWTRSWLHLLGARGVPEVWDLDAGVAFAPIEWRATDEGVSVFVEIPPFGCAVIIVRDRSVGLDTAPRLGPAVAVVEPPFDVTFSPASLPVPVLGPPPEGRIGFEDLGRLHPGFAGTATYACEIVTDGSPAALDLGEVVDCIEVHIDGASFSRRAWPPFVVDLRGIAPGRHRVELAVSGTAANVMPGPDHDPGKRWGLFGPIAIRSLSI